MALASPVISRNFHIQRRAGPEAKGFADTASRNNASRAAPTQDGLISIFETYRGERVHPDDTN
jgi:hypothetical protein